VQAAARANKSRRGEIEVSAGSFEIASGGLQVSVFVGATTDIKIKLLTAN